MKMELIKKKLSADFEILNVETGLEDDENSFEIEGGNLKQELNIVSGKRSDQV
jgi:hypothetical protein